MKSYFTLDEIKNLLGDPDDYKVFEQNWNKKGFFEGTSGTQIGKLVGLKKEANKFYYIMELPNKSKMLVPSTQLIHFL